MKFTRKREGMRILIRKNKDIAHHIDKRAKLYSIYVLKYHMNRNEYYSVMFKQVIERDKYLKNGFSDESLIQMMTFLDVSASSLIFFNQKKFRNNRKNYNLCQYIKHTINETAVYLIFLTVARKVDIELYKARKNIGEENLVGEGLDLFNKKKKNVEKLKKHMKKLGVNLIPFSRALNNLHRENYCY